MMRDLITKASVVGGVLCAVALYSTLHSTLSMAATDREVGVTAGVNTTAQGTPPSGEKRTLLTGTKMHFEEKVVTNATGRAQLLFADGSSMTVGPNSDLVIDTFIYNPDTKTGEMAVNLTKGFIRFVGGRISKKNAVRIKTPIGNIGIRGGIALVEMQPTGALEVDFLFGEELVLEVDGNVQTTTTPGTFMSVAGAGQAPSAPVRRASSALNQRLRSFESQADNDSETADADGQQSNNNQSGGQSGGQSNGQAGGQQAGSNNAGGSAGGGQNADSETADADGQQSNNNQSGGQSGGQSNGQAGGQQAGSNNAGGSAGGGQNAGGGPGSGGGLVAAIETQMANLSDDGQGGGIDIGPTGPGGPTAPQGGSGRTPGSDTALSLDGPIDAPQPRPEEDQPDAVLPPTLDPVVEDPIMIVEPVPKPIAPVEEPTVVVIVSEPEPEPEPEPTPTSTPAPKPLSKTFAGFALRGGTGFSSFGANTTNTLATLGSRRLTSASASGSDVSVGGVLVAASSSGNYQVFFPGTAGASPTNLSACPNASLNCSTLIAGVTPSTVSGPIDHAADPNFYLYALNVDSEKELIVVGTEFTGSAPVTGASIFSIKPDPFLASDLAYIRSSESGFANGGGDIKAYVKWSSTSGSAPFIASAFEIDQTNGKSSSSAIIGRVIGTTNPYLVGVGYGQVDQTATAIPNLYVGGAFSADTDAGRDFFGTSAPDHFILQSVEDADSGGWSVGVTDAAGSTPYFPVNAVNIQGPHTVNAANTQLTNVALTGYYGGAGTLGGTPGAYVATTAADTAFLSLSTGIDIPIVDINVSADAGSTTITTTGGGGAALVDDRHFGTQLLTGATTGGGTEATVALGYLVTGGDNSANFDLCATCEFLTWGLWGHEQSSNGVVFHMASWVAGVATNFGTLGSLAASGTYSGNVIGSIINNNETQVKTGTFAASVTLAGASSTISLTDLTFDGVSFTGGSAFDATASYFAVSTAAPGGRALEMRGAFFGTDGANIPPEIGGDFKITGTLYTAGGVFAGKK